MTPFLLVSEDAPVEQQINKICGWYQLHYRNIVSKTLMALDIPSQKSVFNDLMIDSAEHYLREYGDFYWVKASDLVYIIFNNIKKATLYYHDECQWELTMDYKKKDNDFGMNMEYYLNLETKRKELDDLTLSL